MTSQEEKAGLEQRKVSAQFVCSSFNLIPYLLGIYLGGLQRASDCLIEQSALKLLFCGNAFWNVGYPLEEVFFFFILSFFLVVIKREGKNLYVIPSVFGIRLFGGWGELKCVGIFIN